MAIYLLQKRSSLPTLSLDAGFFEGIEKKETAYTLQAFCEGYLLAGYKFHDLKKDVGKSKPEPKGLKILLTKNKEFESAIRKANVLARAVNFGRSLGDRPANFLPPSQLANMLQKMARENKLKCTMFLFTQTSTTQK